VYESVFNIATDGETCVITIASEIDVSSAETFRRYVDEASAGYGRLAISFERCPYLDSTALRHVFAWAKERGDSFAVVAPAGTRARRVFDLVELQSAVRVCDTLEAFTIQRKPAIA
jgi:anti-anti-sigma factor